MGTDDCHVLIDAGISGKKIENGLNEFDKMCIRDSYLGKLDFTRMMKEDEKKAVDCACYEVYTCLLYTSRVHSG